MRSTLAHDAPGLLQPPVSRPVSVVTGASGGIGRWIAEGLAAAGHHVVLAGRNEQRLAAAAEWIGHRVPGCSLQVERADLTLLAEARGLAERIAGRHPAIHVLVNNAGMFSARRRQTAEGHEQVIALNHLAPFVLVHGLLPAMPAGARIVSIGSDTSDRARLDVDDLESRRRWRFVHAYAQSKLALLIATNGWAQRLQGTGIVANTVHPGAVATGLVRARGPIGLAWRLMAPFLLTEEQGARTPLHVALSEDFAAVTGAYVKRRGPVAPNPLALDPALAAKLWSATEALTGVRATAVPGKAER